MNTEMRRVDLDFMSFSLHLQRKFNFLCLLAEPTEEHIANSTVTEVCLHALHRQSCNAVNGIFRGINWRRFISIIHNTGDAYVYIGWGLLPSILHSNIMDIMANGHDYLWLWNNFSAKFKVLFFRINLVAKYTYTQV